MLRMDETSGGTRLKKWGWCLAKLLTKESGSNLWEYFQCFSHLDFSTDFGSMMLLAPASIACMVLTTRPYTWYLRDDEVRLRFTSMLLTNKYIRFSKYSFFDVHGYDGDASFLVLARLQFVKGTSSRHVRVLHLWPEYK